MFFKLLKFVDIAFERNLLDSFDLGQTFNSIVTAIRGHLAELPTAADGLPSALFLNSSSFEF